MRKALISQALPGVCAVALFCVLAVASLILPGRITTLSPCSGRGAVDTPAEIRATGPSIVVEGWAFDRAGIRAVEVRSAGRLIRRVSPQFARADVVAAFPACRLGPRVGYHVEIPIGENPPEQQRYDVEVVNGLGNRHSLGSVSVTNSGPIAVLDDNQPIRWNGENHVRGWAVSPAGGLRLTVLANGRELASVPVSNVRDDVAAAFRAWPSAAKAGFDIPISMARVPRGRYRLRLIIRDSSGAETEMDGPMVDNDAPVATVRSAEWQYVDPQEVSVRVWAFDEDGVAAARFQTEDGHVLGDLKRVATDMPLDVFEEKRALDNKAPRRGAVFAGQIGGDRLPDGLSRLRIAVADRGGRISMLPGPLVLKGKTEAKPCSGIPLRVYFPGDHTFFLDGFMQLQSLRRMAANGCVEVGMRGRVEYLRTTHGSRGDYSFDPDFPEELRGRGAREMTGESLNALLNTALNLHAPLLITLDGGVWADSKFPLPEFDVVDWLELDDRTVQWNQHGRAEADDALKDLAGSIASPQLARMMSLNRFNERFLHYKKRNLQAAVRSIMAFVRAHPELPIKINFDPDGYINPWFYLTQWYDYNPDTLRQFREWLFQHGPYASGEAWHHQAHQPALSLAAARRLSGQNFQSESEVEPPRGAIDYSDAWQQIWTQFKRHLVARHYEDLATWTVEAGMPKDWIYTSQTFIQADVAVAVNDVATGWTDQAGVSIEGAKPANGHLGVILYGASSRNQGRPRTGSSLMENIRRIDPEWGCVEFHPASIDQPERSASSEEAYATLMNLLNGGARFISPMWGSDAAVQQVHPERFRSYDAFDASDFEYQFVWWLRQLSPYPRDVMLFPFGNAEVASDDGWHVPGEETMRALRGAVEISGVRPQFVSPELDENLVRKGIWVSVAGSWPGLRPEAELLMADGSIHACTTEANELRFDCKPEVGKLGARVRIRWADESQANAWRTVRVLQVVMGPRPVRHS